MSLWAPRELRLLLLLGAILLVGLLIGQGRSIFPGLAGHLEGFDEAPRPPGAATSTAAGAAADPERRREPAIRPGPGTRAGPGSSRSHPPGTDPAAGPGTPRTIELNRASADELATLPGIGPGLAHRIVAERERRGVFETVDALRAVPGLGPRKILRLRGLVTASPEARWSAEPGPDFPVGEPDAAAGLP